MSRRKLEVVDRDGARTRVWPTPPDLNDVGRRMFQQFADETSIVNDSLGAPEFALITSACRSAQAEADLRQLAAEARAEGALSASIKLGAEARAEARSLRASLASLGLAGDRRGRGSRLDRKRAAAKSQAAPAADEKGEGDRWVHPVHGRL